MSQQPFLYPSVGAGSVKSDPSVVREKRIDKKGDSEFDRVLDGKIESAQSVASNALKFSAHASQRMLERKIQISPELMNKVKDALDKAEAKGLEDTLVLTNDAALIVNIPNRTVVTAMDKQALNGNVFTNIDGAVIVA